MPMLLLHYQIYPYIQLKKLIETRIGIVKYFIVFRYRLEIVASK